jgi:hypothetical protein
MNRIIQPLALAICALGLAGCASSSSIKHTWKSPTCPAGPVQKVAVIAVDERNDVRAGLENRLARELRKRSQDATATYKLLGLAEIKADKAAATARLREAGVDAVLVVRLVDQATYSQQTLVTPTVHSSGMNGYGDFGWYDYFSAVFSGMGVVNSSLERVLYLDSSLFDLNNSQRLWSALTQTVLQENADALVAADKLAAKIAKALHQDGLVR